MDSAALILNRPQFQTCHIQVPELDKPLAAICVKGTQFFSFFRLMPDLEAAQVIAGRLLNRGDHVVITPTAKQNYAVWVQETKVILKREHYRTTHVQVPDMDQPLAAIQVLGNQYYSFFKMAADLEAAQTVVNRLQQKGDLAVITAAAKQKYAIWVHEPDAVPTARSRSKPASS